MKRCPTYIDDPAARRLLMALSKADLAEIVYDYARLSANDIDGERPDDVVENIKQHARATFRATGREPWSILLGGM